MRFALLAALGLALFSTPADAGRHARGHSASRGHGHSHHAHATPVRTVSTRHATRTYVSPWTRSYAPTYRSGYVWVDGAYVAGAWTPGYYRPVTSRPGYVWVPGYWVGPDYIDGYWRPASRTGHVWVDGYYQSGSWVTGYWSPVSRGSVSVGTRVGNVNVSVHAPLPR